jgi:pathogenesis-related protein 1
MRRKWLGVFGLLLLTFVNEASSQGLVANDFLAAHNRGRAKVGTRPLAWSDTLASEAQQWATSLMDRGMFAPRRDGRFGQNLFEISGGHATPARVLDAWMSEESNYNHQTNSCTARCGHYTQVVWRNTKLVGCGVARNEQREVWVCDYDPPGNVVGEKPY